MKPFSLAGKADFTPPMCRAEFEDLQRLAGYPFVSDEQAQLFRLRLVRREAMLHMLEAR